MEGTILRLWQVLVITIFISVILFKDESSLKFSKNSYLNSSKVVKQDDSLARRDVLSRESRYIPPVEVYYGNPGIFYLDDMLKPHNIIVYPEDIVKVFPDPSFGVGSKITIFRATKVSVRDNNDVKVYRTWKKTVGELLNEKQISLGDKDLIEPVLNTPISQDLEIKITRVAETNLTQKINLDFKIIKKDDPNLEKGKTRVIQAGKKGVKEQVLHIRRENNKEVSRVLVSEKIISQPQDQIVAYGTKKVITVRCAYQNLVTEAANKYNADPNELCNMMMRESNGHTNSINPDGPYIGLFQYTSGLWGTVSSKAGNGTDIFDARAQIFNTAWAITNGYRGRWP